MTNGQWITYEYLVKMIGKPRHIDYRPSWMEGLELDFFYPEMKLAIEFNGDQHYHWTGFGSPHEQRQRDRRKKFICHMLGITLVSLKAIDLQYSRLRGKFKKAVGKKAMLQCSCSALDRKAAEYRHGLIAKYNSPTARRQGKRPAKEAAKAAFEKHGRPSISDK